MALNYDETFKKVHFSQKKFKLSLEPTKESNILSFVEDRKRNSYFLFIVLLLQFTYVGKHSNGA